MTNDEEPFCEKVIIDVLTDSGKTDLEHCFLLHERTCHWDQGRVMNRKLRDNGLNAACRSFLRSRGAVVASLEAVHEMATEQKWPGWELIGKDDH